jgi:peptidoglycan/xylan/chitin deacetylase (PgdA/CDA1 family)
MGKSRQILKTILLLAIATTWIWSLATLGISLDPVNSVSANSARRDYNTAHKLLGLPTAQLVDEAPVPVSTLNLDSASRPFFKPRYKKSIKPGQTPYWPVRKGVDCLILKCVALTFDDGPSDATAQVLDILKSKNSVATFFVYGAHIQGNEKYLLRMINEGHEIGNHSFTHKSFKKINGAGVATEVNTTQEAIFAATGYRPHLVRPPYGDLPVNDPTLSSYPLVMWSNDPQDWNGKLGGTVDARVLAKIKPGQIVIMHDLKPTSVGVLPQLLDGLKAQGYTTATVSELFNWRTPEAVPKNLVVRSEF